MQAGLGASGAMAGSQSINNATVVGHLQLPFTPVFHDISCWCFCPLIMYVLSTICDAFVWLVEQKPGMYHIVAIHLPATMLGRFNNCSSAGCVADNLG